MVDSESPVAVASADAQISFKASGAISAAPDRKEASNIVSTTLEKLPSKASSVDSTGSNRKSSKASSLVSAGSDRDDVESIVGRELTPVLPPMEVEEVAETSDESIVEESRTAISLPSAEVVAISIAKTPPDSPPSNVVALLEEEVLFSPLAAIVRCDHSYSMDWRKAKRGRGRRKVFVLPIPDDDVFSDDSAETASLDDEAIGLVATCPPIDHVYCRQYFPVPDLSDIDSDDDYTSIDPLPVVIQNLPDVDDVVIEQVPYIMMELDVLPPPAVDDQPPSTEDKSDVSAEKPVHHGKKRSRLLSDVTNIPGSRELASILTPVVVGSLPRSAFDLRDVKREAEIVCELFTRGMDYEDMLFIRRCYGELLQSDNPHMAWVNDTHWVNHPCTYIPDPSPRKKSRRRHQSSEPHSQHRTGRPIG